MESNCSAISICCIFPLQHFLSWAGKWCYWSVHCWSAQKKSKLHLFRLLTILFFSNRRAPLMTLFPSSGYLPPVRTVTTENVSLPGVLPFADHLVVLCVTQGKEEFCSPEEKYPSSLQSSGIHFALWNILCTSACAATVTALRSCYTFFACHCGSLFPSSLSSTDLDDFSDNHIDLDGFSRAAHCVVQAALMVIICDCSTYLSRLRPP